ncbi:SH3 domain-containing protein [uncultured Algibacter sp.]|uniref:SH3 domain-containing protein n=1 Tax=uncultured Algibacter sp. TaxID=298659 RepID=UPI003217DFC0
MKNLKNSIVAICLFAFVSMFAQTNPKVNFKTVTPETAINDISYQYLLGDKVFLRETPSRDAKRLAILSIGTKLMLCDKSEEEEIINGISSHWYEVKVGEYTGWVWGGLIAQKTFGSQAYHNVKFAYGFERANVNEDGSLEQKHQLRAYKNGVQVGKIVFDGHQSTALNMENIGNKGLYNVEDIIALDVPGTNDAQSKGKMYIFWNNGRFTNVATLMDHANTSYSKTESFVFPSDMEGKKSTITLKTFITTHKAVAENDKATSEKELIVSLYKWDGNKLVPKEVLPTISNNTMASTNNF